MYPLVQHSPDALIIRPASSSPETIPTWSFPQVVGVVVVVGVFRLLCGVMWLDRLPTRWQSVVVVSGLAVLIVAVWFFVAHVVPGLLSHDHAGGGRSSASGESSEPGAAGPSAKPTPPPLPPAAREQTEAGAEAFVRYYNDIENYVQRTNDVAPAKELFDPKDCPGCQAIVYRHENQAKRGIQLQGGNYQLNSVKAVKLPNGTYVVQVSLDRDAVSEYDTNKHQVINTVPKVSGEEGSFLLLYKEGRWQLQGVVQGSVK